MEPNTSLLLISNSRIRPFEKGEAHVGIEIIMKLNCTHASADVAGDEYFQVLFEEGAGENRPYLLIQRGFEFEDDETPDPCYVETLDEELIGHHAGVAGVLSRTTFNLTIPGHAESLEANFTLSDADFAEIRRVLGIILGGNLTEEG